MSDPQETTQVENSEQENSQTPENVKNDDGLTQDGSIDEKTENLEENSNKEKEAINYTGLINQGKPWAEI